MTFKTREDLRKERELEVARKAGTAPALTDESGKDINPHIPQYISRAPWYLNHNAPTLKHQRASEITKADIDTWHKRGVKSEVAIKYRKGACENCGAMTHDSKSCVERPRKKGAKFTNNNICPDEYIITHQDLGYDANRDRWAGFDPETHHTIVEEYQDVEEERAKQKMAKLLLNDGEEDISDDEHLKDDGDVLYDSKDSRTRTTTRNLRIREDTAKYLINLDVNSAFYDPKSRSMREDPLLGVKNAKNIFRGDNVFYNSAETYKPKELEVFAWESNKKGHDVNFIANPTKLELLYKQTKEQEKELKNKRRDELIKKYNASEYVENEKELRHLVQVDKSDIIQVVNDDLNVTSSQYDENVYILGHTQIWGSYYDLDNDKWGYKCCKITNKQLNCNKINLLRYIFIC